MSAMPPPTTTPQQQQQTATQPVAPAPFTQQQQQGLPPTGLQQQLNGMNALYGQVQAAGSQTPGAGNIGYNERERQFGQAQTAGAAELGAPEGGTPQAGVGGGSLDSMARNMAQRYGMSVGRGRLVDEQGNFLYTPQQLSDASGGSMTLGEAAANMNYISQALTKKQNEKQQALGIAAIQTGLGQVQQRGRGSLASMQTGQYEAMADLYANQEYESADFSYYIQKEQQDIAQHLQSRVERQARKNAQGGFFTGIATTIVGLYTGNVALIGAGVAQVGSTAGQTGYF
jgi:hypothetical protein